MDFPAVKTPHFEGPLEHLCTLVQKEIPIYELNILSLIFQIREFLLGLTEKAESIAFAGHLLLLKSRNLLPHDPLAPEEDVEGLPLSLMENIAEYCRFKEAARTLAAREEHSFETYTRYKFENEVKKPLGIDHLTLSDLSTIFQGILAKAVKERAFIDKEEWQVADKIQWLRTRLEKTTPFESLFPLTCSKLELIVIFLALLEMMKLGEACITRDATTNTILVYGKERN